MKSLPKHGWALVLLVVVLIAGAFVVRRERFQNMFELPLPVSTLPPEFPKTEEKEKKPTTA
jgi:hypothetical protein